MQFPPSPDSAPCLRGQKGSGGLNPLLQSAPAYHLQGWSADAVGLVGAGRAPCCLEGPRGCPEGPPAPQDLCRAAHSANLGASVNNRCVFYSQKNCGKMLSTHLYKGVAAPGEHTRSESSPLGQRHHMLAGSPGLHLGRSAP